MEDKILLAYTTLYNTLKAKGYVDDEIRYKRLVLSNILYILKSTNNANNPIITKALNSKYLFT